MRTLKIYLVHKIVLRSLCQNLQTYKVLFSGSATLATTFRAQIYFCCLHNDTLQHAFPSQSDERKKKNEAVLKTKINLKKNVNADPESTVKNA